MIVLIIYLIFVVINIIIGSILTYIDYNKGVPITVGIIGIILSFVIFSIFGTAWLIVCTFNKYSEVVIWQKKNK